MITLLSYFFFLHLSLMFPVRLVHGNQSHQAFAFLSLGYMYIYFSSSSFFLFLFLILYFILYFNFEWDQRELHFHPFKTEFKQRTEVKTRHRAKHLIHFTMNCFLATVSLYVLAISIHLPMRAGSLESTHKYIHSHTYHEQLQQWLVTWSHQCLWYIHWWYGLYSPLIFPPLFFALLLE